MPPSPPDTVVLVEGRSDQAAVEVLARRRSRNLADEGISIVAMGGATNIGHYLRRLGPGGDNLRLAGLCDVGEEHKFRRGLELAGFGSNLTRESMESLGFFVCVLDLEDEMIRSLGAERVEGVIEAQREMGSFRIFQRQPAQRGRGIEAQLRRFLGTHSGRKITYGALLAEAVDLERVPRPLDALLTHI
ncbi:MAG TPA: TOPRIM nucleotidyl transferase/hydrolase domain-containing protein [Acidimicrobiia bacterium]|nr:TOPRIM nucleotidyl transferase/hydrolase domain-containing protein [Acidimicrobiia bacterium]